MRTLLPAAFLLAAVASALSGCSTLSRTSPVVTAESTDWRSVITDNDRQRLRGWRSDFITALDRARAAGHAGEITAEGRLLMPDAAIPGRIPNGNYRCRIIKLGAKSAGLLDYVSYPGFACRVQQEKLLQGFAKLSGSQRPVGLIFPGDAMRQVFLGTLVLGDEARMMQYGRDPERDVVGWVEHIDGQRWRMVLPSPRFESITDIVELVPAP